MTQAVRIPGPEASSRADIAFVFQLAGEERDCRLQWLPRIEPGGELHEDE